MVSARARANLCISEGTMVSKRFEKRADQRRYPSEEAATAAFADFRDAESMASAAT